MVVVVAGTPVVLVAVGDEVDADADVGASGIEAQAATVAAPITRRASALLLGHCLDP